jgi:hypothetical protein
MILVLDSASIHKSATVRAVLQRPRRVPLAFLAAVQLVQARVLDGQGQNPKGVTM